MIDVSLARVRENSGLAGGVIAKHDHSSIRVYDAHRQIDSSP
jgi:hypothetical protein